MKRHVYVNGLVCGAVALGFLSVVQEADAQQSRTRYFDTATSGTNWAGATWGTASGGPYTTAWTNWQRAAFEGAAGATINLGAQRNHNALWFDTDGYTLTNGSLRTGSPGGGPHWVVAGGVTATIASDVNVFGHSAALSKSGAGTLNIDSGSFRPRGFNITGGTVNSTASGVMSTGGNNYLRVGFAAGPATLNMTSGTIEARNFVTVADRVGDGGSVINLSGTANLIHNSGGSSVHIGPQDLGTLNVSDSATLATTSSLLLGSLAATGVGVVNQTGGTVTVGNVHAGVVGNGTYNLEGGTLRTNAISESGGSGGAFNWGNGTLAPRDVSGNADNGSTDASSAGFANVFLGTNLDVTGDISTGYLGGSSTLELSQLYISNGIRYDQLTVSGNLDLSGTSDTLAMDLNPYLLRPNIGLAIDSGSIPLVEVGGTLTGSFETMPTILQDTIGWSEFTGSFTTAAALPTNTYFFEETGSGITFHYSVEGTVPEPGTMGLLALGMVLIRGMRDKVRRV